MIETQKKNPKFLKVWDFTIFSLRFNILLKTFLLFLKQPTYKTNLKSFKDNLSDILIYFIFNIIVTFVFLCLIYLSVETGFNRFPTNKASNEAYSLSTIFFGLILSPVIEELIFRFPLFLYFNSKNFKFAFYFSSIVFSLIHIFKFDFDDYLILNCCLILIPVFLGGIMLGYIRVIYGLKFSILLHILHNFWLLIFGLLFSYA
jgi:membrane protease YdiL (CAAX protease family)